ncbi:MAG TPA: hypothetical protein VH062_30320 [Polyangiaceae bacterium]|jgi:hypothetical protein|nr:hypothetical protein [Polyangiaceae bacterium]
MTKKIEKSRARHPGVAALSVFVLPLVHLLGCAARMDDGKSGETHFLCSSDADCTKHFGNDDYSCDGKTSNDETYCVVKSDAGHAGGSGGSTGAGGSTGTGGGAAGKGGSAGDSDAGNPFAGCKTPPDSTCSAEATCNAVHCGPTSLEYDEHACVRTACKSDDECADDERCAVSQCDTSSTCRIIDGQCACSTFESCGQMPRCNPVATTGPRGDWVNLHVESGGFCMTPCGQTWDVGPDGHVTGKNGDRTIDQMLDVAQMFDLKNDVDGPAMRLAFRDGLPCFSEQVTDVSLKVTLQLSTQTFTKDVTGCFGGDNVFANVYNTLARL